MRMRFILSETGTNLRRNLSMLLSLMLVTFISFPVSYTHLTLPTN